jgi:hypothetical protein
MSAPRKITVTMTSKVRRGLKMLLHPLVVDGLDCAVSRDELLDFGITQRMLDDARSAAAWIRALPTAEVADD